MAFSINALDQYLQAVTELFFVSLNVTGAADHNQALLEKWHPRNVHFLEDVSF
jgi:uncharacterized phosphosugar-binding protein